MIKFELVVPYKWGILYVFLHFQVDNKLNTHLIVFFETYF